MQITSFSFGSIAIDGVSYDHDVVIDRGEVHKRNKKASKQFRDEFGHTPLSLEEPIPWNCQRLIIGTGARGALPVMDDLRREAKRRNVELLILPTPEAIRVLNEGTKHSNAVLHVTC